MVRRLRFAFLVFALMAPAVLQAQTDEGQAGVFPDVLGGRVTASGEVYDPGALTAGSPNLRLGMRLAVTNPANGRVVTVKVNDRGPSPPGRVVNLSRAAALALALPSGGPVTIRALRIEEPDVSTPVVEAPPSPVFVPTPQTVSYLQMGAFRTLGNAKKLGLTLKSLGYDPRMRKEGNLYRIYLTVVEDDAPILVDQLTSLGRKGFFQVSREPGGTLLPLTTE